jgi:hypothetical protein
MNEKTIKQFLNVIRAGSNRSKPGSIADIGQTLSI